MPLPPWLNPPNFLGAMQAGASTGLNIRQADEAAAARSLQAEQFAAELALRRDTAAAANEQATRRLNVEEQRYRAADALRQTQQDSLAKWREQQAQAERQRLGLEALRLNQPTSMQKDISAAALLRQSADQKRASGDESGAKQDEYKLALMEGRMMGPSETIETTPQGTIIRRGKAAQMAGNQPTLGFKTQLQQRLFDMSKSIAMLDYINQNQNQSDYGIRGKVKEEMAQWAPQFGFQIEPESMDVRNSLKLVRASMIKALKSDSNITEAERKQLLQALPTEGIDESIPDAISKLNSVRRDFIVSAQLSAEQLGIDPPAWADTPELKINREKAKIHQAYKAGKMSKQQANDAILNLYTQQK